MIVRGCKVSDYPRYDLSQNELKENTKTHFFSVLHAHFHLFLVNYIILKPYISFYGRPRNGARPVIITYAITPIDHTSLAFNTSPIQKKIHKNYLFPKNLLISKNFKNYILCHERARILKKHREKTQAAINLVVGRFGQKSCRVSAKLL